MVPQYFAGGALCLYGFTWRMINRKTKTDKTKTDTNPIPDPTDTGGAVLTLTKTIN